MVNGVTNYCLINSHSSIKLKGPLRHRNDTHCV